MPEIELVSMKFETRMVWWWPLVRDLLIFARYYRLLCPNRAHRWGEQLASKALRARVNGGPWGKFKVVD
jgi:hypothetical protein